LLQNVDMMYDGLGVKMFQRLLKRLGISCGPSSGPRVKKFFLVHGEQQQSEALQLQRNGRNALVPSQGQVVELD
jgi:hypothetical protein